MPRFTYACPLRWSDQDAYGHVNNVQFLRYLEEARVALFFDGASAAGVDSFEGSLVVVRHEIDYRRPLRYRTDPILVDAWLTGIRRASFTVGYAVRDGEETYADAATVLAGIDPATGRARPLTEAERTWLGKYADDQGSTGPARPAGGEPACR